MPVQIKPFLSLMLLFFSPLCHAQNINAQQIWDGIVNKYWVQREVDILYLARPADESDMEFSMINFRSNGTFHERRKTTCGRDKRSPYSGAWRISGDTIIANTYEGYMLYYKIIKIDSTTVRYVYSWK